MKMDPNAPTTCDAKRYSNLVNLHLRASLFGERKECLFLFDDEGKNLSDQKIMSLQGVNSLRVLRRLEPLIISSSRGKQIITYKDTSNGDTQILIPVLPSLTSIYKALMKIHLKNDHAPSMFMKAQLEEMNPLNLSYQQVPNICYDLIQHFCKGCNKNYTGASVRGSVCFMYQMSLVPKTKYPTLMIYIDENTEYIFLRPINVVDIDVENELFKLFMQIGTPESININHTCKMITYSLQNKMQIVCPTVKITSDNDRENDKYLIRIIMNEIGAWMKNADSKIWQLGCSVIQNQLNNTIRATIPNSDVKVSAYDLFYKNPAIFGLSEDSRWFPDSKRRFIVNDFSENTFFSPYKSKIKASQVKSVETSLKSQEQTKSVSIQTVPLNEEEAKKNNTNSNRGRRGRGRSKKNQ